MKTELYICSHFLTSFPEDPHYIPIHVGKALGSENLGILGDDTGDSISALNKSFCELTALYWMWKNSHADIIGLNHYKRFLAPKTNKIEFGGRDIAGSDDFAELFEGVDIIVPTPVNFAHSAYEHYANNHIHFDLFLLREQIKEHYPNYIDAYDFILGQNRMIICNMFVSYKKIIDEYCYFLFTILLAMQKMRFYVSYDAYQKRVFGFLAERLFNVWLCKNRHRFCVSYRDVIVVEPVNP